MRTTLVSALVALVVAAGCANAIDTPAVEPVTADASATAVEPTTTVTPVATAVPVQAVDGRSAIAAAQGTPHILWFWGAH